MIEHHHMKHLFTLLAVTATSALSAQSISTSGFTFTPNLLTVLQGEEITLSIGGGHTMTEVSEATWNANQNTSNGGFNFSSGNHTLTLNTPGTYYYVCQPHAGMGMKGRIVVEINTGLPQHANRAQIQVFPNPATTEVQINAPASNQLRLIDTQGREVLRRNLTGNDRLDVANFEAGNYMAIVVDGTGTIVARERFTIAR
jgi:plastocyanin